MLTLSQTLTKQGHGHKRRKHHVQLVVPGKNSAVSLDSSKQPLHLIALTVSGLVQLPWLLAFGIGWHDWNKVACQGRRAGVVTFVGAVHEQINLLILAAHYGWRPFFLSPTTVGVVQAQGLDSTSNSNTLVVDG